MQLTDAVVLVTGASAGIGRVTAVRFAARGARILVHGRDPERTQKVADEVRGRALVADLASPADRQRLAAEALDAFGHVDVLVNNAHPLAAAGDGRKGLWCDLLRDVDRRAYRRRR